MSLRPLASWDCGLQSRQGRVYLSVMIVVCCQVEISALGLSLVQRSPTDCGVCLSDSEAWIIMRSWSNGEGGVAVAPL